jgi:hypothetical protein
LSLSRSGQPHVLHGHRDLDREKLEQSHVVGGEGFGTGPRLLVGGNQDAEGAGVALERDGHELVGVYPLVPRVIEVAGIESFRTESADDRDRFHGIPEVEVSRTKPEQCHEVVDQLLRQGVRLENAADAGGDRANSFEFP